MGTEETIKSGALQRRLAALYHTWCSKSSTTMEM
jgi:hypothetical protein